MFHCKVCAAKDKEIERLYKLIDSLLLKIGVSPVESKEIEENWQDEKEDETEEVIG